MNETRFLRNWKALAPLLLAKWPKLKESDLDGLQPRVDEVIKVLQKKYHDIPKKSLIEDLENLSQQTLKNPGL